MRKELEYRDPDEGTLQYIRILLLFTNYPEIQVKYAVGLCVQRRVFNAEAVLNVLHNEPLPDRAQLDLSDRPEFQAFGDGTRNTAIYDQLKGREEVTV
jgi:hypothetical protein